MRRSLALAVFFACAGLVAAPAVADPLRVVFVSGSFLYESDTVLGEYKTWLESTYPVAVTLVSAKDSDDFPGLEALDTCDVALFYTRRLKIDGEQLQYIRNYARAGKPIVAVRTASHGFENWPDFDREILGGDYQRHFPDGPVTRVTLAEPHEILDGVTAFTSTSSLYRNRGIADDCTVLLRGTLDPGTGAVTNLGPEESFIQPIAWIRDRNPGRVFYTSLGAADDFAQDAFKRVIANALYWAASLESPSAVSAAGTTSSESK